MTHLEDKLLSFESKNLLWSFSGWTPKWALCYLKSGSKLILGEVSANISKLLRKERGKVPRICWCSHSQTCEKYFKRIWLLGLCFGKKNKTLELFLLGKWLPCTTKFFLCSSASHHELHWSANTQREMDFSERSGPQHIFVWHLI